MSQTDYAPAPCPPCPVVKLTFAWTQDGRQYAGSAEFRADRLDEQTVSEWLNEQLFAFRAAQRAVLQHRA
jgi:hypothetical protein